MRWWVYRNNAVAFAVQQRDPYYEDCGVNIPATNIPPYVPASPGSAVNKYLATTIVSGGGTASIVVANAAGATASGQTALHDNSANLLACMNASRFGTPCYIPLAANPPFNAATVFTGTNSGNGHLFMAGISASTSLGESRGRNRLRGLPEPQHFLRARAGCPAYGWRNNSYALPVFLGIPNNNAQNAAPTRKTPRPSIPEHDVCDFSQQASLSTGHERAVRPADGQHQFRGLKQCRNVNIPAAIFAAPRNPASALGIAVTATPRKSPLVRRASGSPRSPLPKPIPTLLRRESWVLWLSITGGAQVIRLTLCRGSTAAVIQTLLSASTSKSSKDFARSVKARLCEQTTASLAFSTSKR